MAQKRSVRVRLSNQRLEALQDICAAMLEGFLPDNDHHHLLAEYMRDLQQRLILLLKKTQGEYTLSLSGTETLAFYQLWQMHDLKHDKYARVIVETMLNKMSRLAA